MVASKTLLHTCWNCKWVPALLKRRSALFCKRRSALFCMFLVIAYGFFFFYVGPFTYDGDRDQCVVHGNKLKKALFGSNFSPFCDWQHTFVDGFARCAVILQVVLYFIRFCIFIVFQLTLNSMGDEAFSRVKDPFQFERRTMIHGFLGYLALSTALSTVELNDVSGATLQGYWYYHLTWSVIFLGCPFPSRAMHNRSCVLAQGFGFTIMICELIANNAAHPDRHFEVSTTNQTTAVVFTVLEVSMVVATAIWALARAPDGFRPPSCRVVCHVFWDWIQQTFGGGIVRKKILEPTEHVDERCSPGFLSFIAIIYSSLILLLKVSIVLIRDEQLSSCGNAASERQCRVSDTHRAVICISNYVYVFHILVPLLVLADFELTKRYWTAETNRAIVQAFGELDWHPYARPATEWVVDELLATGAEGEVYTATLSPLSQRFDDSCPNQLICVKQPHVDGSEALQAVLHETAVLIHLQEWFKLLTHEPQDAMLHQTHNGSEHVVKLLGVCLEVSTVAILLPYCNGGDLLHFLHGRPKADSKESTISTPSNPLQKDEVLPLDLEVAVTRTENPVMKAGPVAAMELSPVQQTARFDPLLRGRIQIALQVAKGLCAVHSAGVAHLDVKSDNVLLHDGVAKLTDFGCAIKIKCKSTRFGTNEVAANSGTPAFMAPELCHQDPDAILRIRRPDQAGIDPFAADVYSFGFLLYECITLEREPECRRQETCSMTELPVLAPGEMDGEWGQVSRDLVHLVSSCWREATQRPTFGGDGGVVEQLEAMLRFQIDPEGSGQQ